MTNDPYAAQSAAHVPRLRVLVGNQPIAGALRASVTSNNFYQCDHFSISFATSAATPGWWDIEPPLVLDVQVSLDGTAWQSLIVGEVDHQAFQIQAGTLDLEGRDLSARFIEAKTQEAFVNQTSSEVTATLAARHGMATNITPTTTPVGRYYTQDHTNVTLGQFSRTTTEWELLVYLVQQEGFDVFMTGNTLNFQPSQSTAAPVASPFVLNWSPPAPVPRLNAVSLTLDRSLTLAKDVVVQVKSWSSRQARGFTKTAHAIGGSAGTTSKGSSTGTPTTQQKYVVVRPNLTEDAAQKLANQIAHEITLHERIVAVEMPGELTLTPRNMVRLQGTATSFDQVYYIASIERSVSFEEGFRQSLRLKNSSPRTQAQV